MSAPIRPVFDSDEVAEQERLMGELVETVASGEALAFVGAGSSCAAGYPSWPRLIERLALEAQDVDSTFVPDPTRSLQEQAQQARERLVRFGSKSYYAGKMTQIFHVDPVLTEFHRNIVSLPFRQVLTTNYDLTLEKAFGEQRDPANPVGAEPGSLCVAVANRKDLSQAIRRMVMSEPLMHVIHLHGCVKPVPNYVLCTSEYAEEYGFDPWSASAATSPQRLPYLPTMLSALLMTRRLVFVGYGHTDQYISRVLRNVADSTWEWEDAIHFAILPIDPARAVETKADAKMLQTKMGIATIFYESSNGDYSGGERLVERLLDGVRQRMAPLPTGSSPTVSTRPLPTWWANANARALSGGP